MNAQSTLSSTPTRAVALVVVVVAMLLPVLAQANVGRVEFAIGEVVGVDKTGKHIPLVKGTVLENGYTVRTGNGRAQIRFADGAYTSLQPNTVFRIDDFEYDKKDATKSRSFFSLLKGGLRTITGAIGKIRKKSYQITTPVATIGIRGTAYSASLENSLHVHIDDGEIEVCNSAGCTGFGPFQSGFVPSEGSPAILANDPPSLNPPESQSVYTVGYDNTVPADPSTSTGGLQGNVPYAAGDVNQTDAAAPLPDGAQYALAVAWNDTTSAELFARGLLPNQLIDATFQGNVGLVQYGAGNPPLVNGSLGTAQLTDVGFVPGVIGWGRWTNGTATVGLDAGGSTSATFVNHEGHHYVIGMPTPTSEIPAGGTASYSLVGATSPTSTFSSGPGTVNSASLMVDFGTSTVNMDMNFNLDGINYNSNVPMNLGPERYTFSDFGTGSTSSAGGPCGSPCPTFAQGYFAGSNASHAGAGYKVQVPSFDYITGGVAFQKGP